MEKQNKGITLIALVITIIVLLILAGVSIATLTGENGILTQANKAKTETRKAGAKEQAKIAIMASYDSEGKLDYEKLKENLENIGVTGIPDDKTFPLIVTIDGEKIEIKEDGTIELAFHAEEWDKTACKESCFLWESDDPNSGEAYHTIIGYAEGIQNEAKFKIPSRCHKITCNYENWNNQGREFAKTFTTVEIPDTVVEIGYYAFSGFGLTKVTIPNGVTSIGDGAFNRCDGLSNIVVPSNVKSIGCNSFANCSGLINIALPKGISRLGERAFSQCNSLTDIVLPDSVTSIGRECFSGCSALKNIQIPNSVVEIDHFAFSECKSLEHITIPDSVINVGQGLFGGCSKLIDFQIPSGWTEIPYNTFYECESLTSIIIPDGITFIGTGAFLGCSNIKNIVIPESVVNIDSFAFRGWEEDQTIKCRVNAEPMLWNPSWDAYEWDDSTLSYIERKAQLIWGYTGD